MDRLPSDFKNVRREKINTEGRERFFIFGENEKRCISKLLYVITFEQIQHLKKCHTPDHSLRNTLSYNYVRF